MAVLDALNNFLTHHWLVVSFAAPALWALVNIIDVYFVKGIYLDELDGTIISGLFQMVPWLVLGFFFRADTAGAFFAGGVWPWFAPEAWLGFAGGLFFTAAFYFYFKALFSHSDAALLQIMWSLTIVVVPALSFFLWGETLPIIKYAGMGIVLVGAVTFTLSKTLQLRASGRYVAIMMCAVFLLSLGMVCEDRAYTLLADKGLGDQAFLAGFLLFSLGAFAGGILFALFFRRNPWPLLKKYAAVFVVIEGVSFLGTLASQRAISLSPSVSFVAAVETMVPAFIALYSVLIMLFAVRLFGKSARALPQMYREQLAGWPVKLCATLAMAAGVYIISS